MKNDGYGQYEQVNGGVVNDLNDKLDNAVELLGACSEELFINGIGDFSELEKRVDLFLEENGKPSCTTCKNSCADCSDEPDSLKPQAD